MRLISVVNYDGRSYNGWQRLPDNQSIQAHLEFALSKIANAPIVIYAAGRTDAGVHATYQVIHFDTDAIRHEDAWLMGANRFLPPDIRIQSIHAHNQQFDQLMDSWHAPYPLGKTQRPISKNFHARFSAIARHYRYFIYNGRVLPSLLYQRCYWYQKRLDSDAMTEAIRYLQGEHDFSSFRDSQCQALYRRVNVYSAAIQRDGDWIAIDICANAFLKQMVRNIVGALMQVGLKNRSVEWFKQLLDLKDRSAAAGVAPAQGLYLIGVTYPKHYPMPEMENSLFQLPHPFPLINKNY